MSKDGFDDSKFVPYAERPRSFSGVAVLERQPAQMPHPHPSQLGRLTPTRGVTHVMLANGYEFFECDYNCGYTRPEAASVRAHLTAHNPGKNTPDYDIKLLEALVTVAREERTRGFRGYCERTAERLNAAGYTMLNGRPFTTDNISHLFNQHQDKFPPRRRPGRPRKEATAPVDTNRTDRTTRPRVKTSKVDLADAVKTARGEDPVTSLNVLLSAAAELIGNARSVIAQLEQTGSVDAEVRRKAELYDQMRRLVDG